MTDFETTTQAEWMALVEAGLKGRSYEDVLVKRTDDGLVRGPLATASSRPAAPYARIRVTNAHLAGRPWHIAAPVRDPDISFANAQALRDLQGGASALRISLDPNGANGTPIRTPNGFKRLFEGIHTDLIPVTLAPGLNNASFAGLLAANEDWHGLDLTLGLSPLSQAMTYGTDASFTDVITAVKWAAEHASGWRVITVNAGAVHEAGGSEAQELAYIASATAAYFRALTIAGIDAETLAPRIAIELAADQDGHLGIAKIRAARLIFARIAESFGVPDDHRSVPIQAVTSLRMMTKIDPWTNLLRIMAAGFGAVSGGADHVTTRPFTDALTADGMGLPTAFGHRIARNMQLMMMEESHLGQVTDPANGSYFHEQMTHSLAQKGWEIFQTVEMEGGLETPAAREMFTRSINKARRQRQGLIARQQRPVLGVSLYPSANTRPAEIRRPQKFVHGTSAPLMTETGFRAVREHAKSGHALPATPATKPVLPPSRLSEPFERLLVGGQRPSVLLVALSHDAMTTARIGFLRGYLGAAAIPLHIMRPQSLLLPVQEAAEAAASPIVMFAGTDSDYAEKGPKVAKALKEVRPVKIYLCAKPQTADKYSYAYSAVYNGQDRIATVYEMLGLMGEQIDA